MKVQKAIFAAALLLCPWLVAAQTARVTYMRSFKESKPAFLQIEIARDGAARYQAREVDSDPLSTLTFTASPAVVQEVFAATAALHEFAQPLQSKQPVAYTGDKMLAFDDAGHHQSQSFTYTTDKPAAKLVDLFEKISVTGMNAIRLQRALQYQPLDVLALMNHIQDDWSNHMMAEPQLLAPTLEKLVADGGAMAAAQHRAEKLLAEFKKR
ncbi:MAG TPA: hypothetical protein VFP94_07800 [Terriglobales bacterium]|nr:hypothetical protein [Terriglobales bacterium]